MNGFFGKLGMGLRKFMAGRYGTDYFAKED